jgi:DNA-binding transcriptional regulator YhcF (GntR family)
MNNKFVIDIKRSCPLYVQVKQNLVRLIDSGALKPGGRIPPEVEIARECNISRGTVRVALAELAREGLISRRQKRGSFVLENLPDNSIRIGVWAPVLALRSRFMEDYYVAELEKSLRTAAQDQKVILLLFPKCDHIDQIVQLMASNDIAGLLVPAPSKKDEQLLAEIQKRKSRAPYGLWIICRGLGIKESDLSPASLIFMTWRRAMRGIAKDWKRIGLRMTPA